MFRKLFPVCMIVIGLAIIGCTQSHPGNYAQPEVESQVKKSLELTEIQITADPAGSYSGTGKSASGETYKLKITQDAAAKRLTWKAEGDRGDFRDGEYHFE